MRVRDRGTKNTDKIIERSVNLFGLTPSEKSDENIKWMLKNGYSIAIKSKRGHRRK